MNQPIRKDILQSWRVLIVDDDPGSLEVASFLLSHYGAEVLTATNGAVGLDAAKTMKPNLILTDISMPVMDGWGMIECLKRDVSTVNVPIIALTAHAMQGDRERAIASGCHNYLSKPLTPTTFISDLLSLLVNVPELMGRLKDGSVTQTSEAENQQSESTKGD